MSISPNVLWVFLGTSLLGLCCGALGTFVFLRRRGLVGDVLAHATLPGICVAFLLTGGKELVPFLLGSIVAALCAAFCIYWLPRHTPLHEDSTLAIVLSFFFSVGVVLLTRLQYAESAQQSGLDRFLLGQAASLIPEDLRMMAILATILLVTLVCTFKELKILCFDPAFAESIGFSARWLDSLLLLLTTLAVTIGLQAVGVIFVAALLIIPAAAARYWATTLRGMTWIAAGIGLLAGVMGTMVSAYGLRVPTGPSTILTASACFFISFLFAPQRGMVARSLERRRLRFQLQRETLWQAMGRRYRQQQVTCWTWEELQAIHPSPQYHVRHWERQGWITLAQQEGKRMIHLTARGQRSLPCPEEEQEERGPRERGHLSP